MTQRKACQRLEVIYNRVMTNEQIIAKLNKTRKSIATALYYGHTMNGSKLQTLVDRYGDLREALTTQDYAAWKGYCQSQGACPSHDAYDLLA